MRPYHRVRVFVIAVAVAEKFGLPIHAIGVGEGIEDLRSFEAENFAQTLVGLA